MVTGKRFVLIMILYTSQKSTIDIVFFFPFFRIWKQVFLEVFFPLKKTYVPFITLLFQRNFRV